jgi:hypothetical protein
MILTMSLVISLLFSASPVAAFAIEVTGNIQDWAFTPGSTNEYPTPLTLTVTTETYPWTVNVKDALEDGKMASSAGRLLEYNAVTKWVNTGSVIAGNMTVVGESSSGVTGTTATLGPTDQLIETGSAAVTGKQMAITLRQPITYTDPYLSNGNTYRVVITFTVVQP